MTTQMSQSARAYASSDVAAWRHVDPLTAQLLARYARQEMIVRFVGDAWKAVTTAIAKRIRGRAVYQELSELPDHLLADIGVRRDQVEAVAYRGMTRPATDLESAASHASLSFFEHRPAAVAAAPRDVASADKPLAA